MRIVSDPRNSEVLIRIDSETKEAFRKLALIKGKTMSQLIREAIIKQGTADGNA